MHPRRVLPFAGLRLMLRFHMAKRIVYRHLHPFRPCGVVFGLLTKLPCDSSFC
jgi:hypothetical protein